MTYTVTTGLVKQKLINAKKIVVGVVASVGIAGAFALPAFAASNEWCGSSAKGCDAANAAGAQCGSGAASGAFGALGKGNNPGDPSWDGGNGDKPGTTSQTGLNNSAICGNRQGNL